MPVDRVPVSLSQFAELLGLEPARFLGVEFDRRSTGLTLVLEPEAMAQTSGTFPQLNTGGKKIGKAGGKGKRMLTRIILVLSTALAIASSAAAQTAVPTDRLGFDQAAASLATANAYAGQVELDGTAGASQTVTCTGTTSPFVCVTALPAMTPGTHTLRVRVAETVNGVVLTSAWSAPLSVTMRAVPATPANPRLVTP